MSVLRDAIELGYGSDHFMITGENFPPEWQDDYRNVRYENIHERDDSDISSLKTNHIDEYVHPYIRKYNAYNDYIQDYMQNHYSFSHKGAMDLDKYHSDQNYNLDQNGAKKINKVTGKVITNRMLDITNYIKNIDISQARKQGIAIKNIRCSLHPLKSRDVLNSNIERWIENEKVLLSQKVWTEKLSIREKQERLEKHLSTKDSTVRELIFSNFKIKTKATLEVGQNHILFSEVGESEGSRYRGHPNYNPQGTPTMLQIAFALIKKYEDMEIEVRGYIPGINEPIE